MLISIPAALVPRCVRGAILAGLMVWSIGCQVQGNVGPPPDDETDDGMVSFARDLQPIFGSICTTCHTVGGAADLAGIDLNLTTDVAYAMLVNQPSSQQPESMFVVPGDAEASYLFVKISEASPPVGLRMPRFSPPLSDADIDLVRDWINQGALDN